MSEGSEALTGATPWPVFHVKRREKANDYPS
jgi:hypothetical protein